MPLRLADGDITLFKTIAEYRLLSAREAAYLLARNVPALQRRLNALLEAGFVERLVATGTRGGRGRPELVYGISKAGVDVLVTQNVLDCRVDAHHATAEAVLIQTGHQHLVNAFRFSLLELERQSPEFSIRSVSSNSPFAMDSTDGYPMTQATVQLTTSEGLEPSRFVPDCVFHICHRENAKSLLFFLEADTGSEPLASSTPRKPSVARKICCYQEYFRGGGYKTYESRWIRTFSGFRLLFLCSDAARAGAAAKTVRSSHPSDFVWVTSLGELAAAGVSGSIWRRGGNEEKPRQSILGTFARRPRSLS